MQHLTSRAAALCFALAAIAPSTTSAQETASRRVEIRFTPTARASIALWIESEDGSVFRTVRLTEAVSVRGIGNRPGAMQMNGGYRWPYGRREGALPVWGHRRIAAGGEPFPRVIFNGRRSEGNASSAGSAGEPRNTRDEYYCLSFNRELSGRDALDAMSCASVFMSNKGRYATEEDVAAGYAEPFEEVGGAAMMRSMDTTSIYPPRRDVVPCEGPACGDHDDVGAFAEDARRIMPEIDAVTMATLMGELPTTIVFDVPPDWENGAYVVYAEVHVEGDWNDAHNGEVYPTPTGPSGMWDYWAVQYGYPYRGQPSVVYRVPFTLGPAGGTWAASQPSGYGALHGEDGAIRPLDGTIIDDPAGAPGSGADRLRGPGERLGVTVPQWDICSQAEPPPECGRECTPGDDTCGRDLVCGPDFACVGLCDVPMSPGAVPDLEVLEHTDEKNAHHWATLRFRVPDSPRRLARYEVRVGTAPIVDQASFERALPAVQANIERTELVVPVEGAPGELIELEFGGMSPETTYYVAVRAIDECNAPGPIGAAEITTTPIFFTTVSPCFVATAAWGTPMAAEIGALRRFRDRHLRTNAIGRAFVSSYERWGPAAADWIREGETRRSVARAALAPFVAVARWLD